jgi:hypothetical protein
MSVHARLLPLVAFVEALGERDLIGERRRCRDRIRMLSSSQQSSLDTLKVVSVHRAPSSSRRLLTAREHASFSGPFEELELGDLLILIVP